MRFGSELTVHLDHLAFNVAELKQKINSCEILFMVKANAYGHGLGEITHFSHHELNIKRFGCASLGEAIYLRQNFPQTLCDLWVFSDGGDLSDSEIKEAFLELNIIPVIHHLKDLKVFLNDRDFKFMPLVLKFDTGMHRIGLALEDQEEVIQLIKQSGRKQVDHLMTHFASSYIKHKAGDKTQRQLDSFHKVKAEMENAGLSIIETSCANSGAIEQGIGLEESFVRPGLMLYGPKSFPESSWQGKCLSTLRSSVLRVLPVTKGMPIGYGGHVVAEDGFMAYLPLGYGDGILTTYSGVKINCLGEQAQFIGRINMDMCGLFFKKLPPGLEKDEKLVLWGEEGSDISHIAAQMKTIPYQLFTAISQRVPRRYIF